MGLNTRCRVAGLLLLGLSLTAHASASCTLKSTELKATVVGARPLIDVKLNGEDARLLLDSGAFFSMLWPGTVTRLQLKAEPASLGFRVKGIGGAREMALTRVDRLTLGNTELPDMEFLVAGTQSDPSVLDVAGLMGQNILHASDAEYDLANGLVHLVQPSEECSHRDLAHWVKDPGYSKVALIQNPGRQHILTTAYVNGVAVRAMLDSGAPASMILTPAARRAGVDLSAPDVRALEAATGIGAGSVRQWIASIQSFRIGNEESHDTPMRVVNETRRNVDADVLLGMDFLLAHHIYVANSQNRMYFTSNDGLMFSTITPSGQGSAAAAVDIASAAERRQTNVGSRLDLPARGDLLQAGRRIRTSGHEEAVAASLTRTAGPRIRRGRPVLGCGLLAGSADERMSLPNEIVAHLGERQPGVQAPVAAAGPGGRTQHE